MRREVPSGLAPLGQDDGNVFVLAQKSSNLFQLQIQYNIIAVVLMLLAKPCTVNHRPASDAITACQDLDGYVSRIAAQRHASLLYFCAHALFLIC